MKVLFATRTTPGVIAQKAQNALSRVRHLPCKLVECYSADDVRDHIKTADVILLDNGYRHVPFWDQIVFVNNSSVYKGRFHVDMWLPRETAAPEGWDESSIKLDVRIIAYRELREKYRPEWKSVFWSPHCISVQNYDIPRDIDVLFWGACTEQYPFRQYVSRKLGKRITGEGTRVDPFLIIYNIRVRGHEYKYGVVRFVPNPVNWKPPEEQKLYGYYGPRLFRLLSRTRICCTGSAWGVPVGKYMEHAACGVVSLTNSFTDADALGFKHGENIWFTDQERFMEDLAFLLEAKGVVETLSKNAKTLVETLHTPAVRGRELYKFLCKATGKE